MNTETVCARAGLSYRQADYWTRSGLIPGVANLRHLGSGNPREWTRDQVEFVTVLAQLIRAGVKPRVASDALQQRIAEGVPLAEMTDVTLPGGLTVTLRPRLAPVPA